MAVGFKQFLKAPQTLAGEVALWELGGFTWKTFEKSRRIFLLPKLTMEVGQKARPQRPHEQV